MMMFRASLPAKSFPPLQPAALSANRKRTLGIPLFRSSTGDTEKLEGKFRKKLKSKGNRPIESVSGEATLVENAGGRRRSRISGEN
jgi:hypothetical protein